MGCGKNDDVFKSHKGCVCEVVRAIKDIQDAVENDDCECPRNCFLEPLGSLVSPTRTTANTRVFVLLTAEGKPFHAFFKDQINPTTTVCGKSIFFRVEEIFDNCCATLRVLRREDQTTCCNSKDDCDVFCDGSPFVATNDCVTVDLNCFCAIQCIADVFIDLCE